VTALTAALGTVAVAVYAYPVLNKMEISSKARMEAEYATVKPREAETFLPLGPSQGG